MLSALIFFLLMLIYTLRWWNQNSLRRNSILLSHYVKHIVSRGTIFIGVSLGSAENMPAIATALAVWDSVLSLCCHRQRLLHHQQHLAALEAKNSRSLAPARTSPLQILRGPG